MNWVIKVNGVDYYAAEHINLLQTEKMDRDGQVPMTGVQQWDKGTNVTPAATVLTLGSDGNYFDVAAGNFASIVQLAVGGASVQAGTIVKLHFNGVCIITHSANLYMPGAVNCTTKANDELEFVCFGPDQWRCMKEDMAVPLPIGETTPNTIRGKNIEILVPDTAALSAAQCSGTIINNYGMADADAMIDLPAAAAGLSFVVVLGAARAHYYRLRCLAAADDKIYLLGTAGADDGYVGIAAAVVGASISFFTFQTGAGAYDWYAIPISGTWVAG